MKRKPCPNYEKAKKLTSVLRNNAILSFFLYSPGSVIEKLAIEKLNAVRCNNSSGMRRLSIGQSKPKKCNPNETHQNYVSIGWICLPKNNGCGFIEIDSDIYNSAPTPG